MDRLRRREALRSRLLKVVGQRWIVSGVVRGFTLMMARQPDYQPLNLKEIAACFSRPPEAHQRTLAVLSHLENMDSGYAGAAAALLPRDLPYDVYLMLVAERTFIVHGQRDPAGVLAALERICRDGCPWFRQSALYVLYHVLSKAAAVEDDWLDRYVTLTREVLSGSGGTLQTAIGRYPLIPHASWAEVVLERHRPAGRARVIPQLFADARDNVEYATRLIRACQILNFAYRQHAVALDALRESATLGDARFRGPLVDALANIRFPDERVVDAFLRELDNPDLERRVKAATPTVRASDFPTWIDEFVIHSLMYSDDFRRETVRAFTRAAQARSAAELLHQVITWGMNLIAGEKVLTES